MALKAPGILIFLVSIILALAVLFSKFAGATIPFFTGDSDATSSACWPPT